MQLLALGIKSDMVIRALLRRTIARSIYQWYKHRAIQPTDVVLASFPKSGNTWLKFMLATVIVRRAVDFDDVESIIPPVASANVAQCHLPSGGRLLKTHECYRREYEKAILLVRDGRDAIISYYFAQKRSQNYAGSLAEFINLAITRGVDVYGRWGCHVNSWLAASPRMRERLLVVRYEDLLAQPVTELSKLVKFLGFEIGMEQLSRVVEANTLQQMRSKEIRGRGGERSRARGIYFVRRGGSGEWREHFTREQNVRFLEEAGDILETLRYSRA